MDKQAALRFIEQSPWAEALARLHAAAFAEYTYQLLRRLVPEESAAEDPGLPIYEPLENLDDAPEWIRESFKEAQRASSRGLSDAAARAIVARNRLHEALRRRNLSQAALARKLKKKPAAISRIFKAPHRSRVTTLQQIADVLGVELADLFDAQQRPTAR